MRLSDLMENLLGHKLHKGDEGEGIENLLKDNKILYQRIIKYCIKGQRGKRNGE